MRDCLQLILDNEFYGSVEVMSEQLIAAEEDLPDQCVVYTIIGRYPTNYSDNQPRSIIERAEIACYAKSIREKEAIRERVVQALWSEGITIEEAGSDLSLGKESQYFGCTIECSRTVSL